MIATLALVLLTAASVGCGAAILRACDCLRNLPQRERWSWSFALGFGALGWLAFPLGVTGHLTPTGLWLLVALPLPGLWFLRHTSINREWHRPSWTTLALVGLLVAVAIGDLAEALTPPADADTLAYHFYLPKLFLREGAIVFVPRAVDGAVPLLPQMTYALAFGLGGERAATLWCFVSGWGAAALAYSVARRYLSVSCSLALALLLQTTPAMLYGAGTGQVEARIAMFSLLGAVCVADSWPRPAWRHAVLAGLAAGFYAASKYPGLLFIGVAGAAILLSPGGARKSVAFGAGALLAGFQWYAWNAAHSGDPLFPALYGFIPYLSDSLWNAAQQAYLNDTMLASEKVLPANVFWLFAYPVMATLFPSPFFEAGRTGLGILPLIALPFALGGFWAGRREPAARFATILAALAAVYYALWFLFGPSQRVRHLLPILPVLFVAGGCLIGLLKPAWQRPIAAAVAVTLVIQLAGQVIFARKNIEFLLAGATREAFLRKSVSGYAAAEWANTHLKPSDRVFVAERQLNYLFDMPIFYGHHQLQIEIEIRPDARPARFWSQLRQQQVTHVISSRGEDSSADILASLLRALQDGGCATPVGSVTTQSFVSRTLAGLGQSTKTADIHELTPSRCDVARLPG